MPGEKSIKPYWKEQLDKLTPEPGSFDKEASWEKLQSRLEKKSRRFGWIPWMAAAAMTGIILIIVFTNRQPNKADDLTKIPVTKTDQPAVADKEDRTTASITPVVPEHTTNEQKETFTKKENILSVDKNDKPEQAPLVIVNETPEPPKTDTSLAITTTAIAAPVVKKKLSIVHKNEIGTPVHVAPAEEKAVAKAGPLSFPGFRKPLSIDSDMNENPASIKPKKSMLPFSSLISQKE